MEGGSKRSWRLVASGGWGRWRPVVSRSLCPKPTTNRTIIIMKAGSAVRFRRKRVVIRLTGLRGARSVCVVVLVMMLS